MSDVPEAGFLKGPDLGSDKAAVYDRHPVAFATFDVMGMGGLSQLAEPIPRDLVGKHRLLDDPELLELLEVAVNRRQVAAIGAEGRREDQLQELAVGLLLLLASGGILAISPDLESRRVAGFFGDPSLLSVTDCLWIGALMTGVAFTLWHWRHDWLRVAFDQNLRSGRARRSEIENAALAFVLAVAVVKLGLVYTITTLTIPAFFARSSRSFGAHQGFLVASGTIAGFFGFLGALALEDIPSVYVIGGVQALTGLLWLVALAFWGTRSRPHAP